MGSSEVWRRLQRWREPVGWLLVAGLAGVLGLVLSSVGLTSRQALGVAGAAYAGAAQLTSSAVPLLVLLAVVVATLRGRPAVPRAGPLGLLAAVVAVLVLAVAVVLTALGASFSGGLDGLTLLLGLLRLLPAAVPVLVVVELARPAASGGAAEEDDDPAEGSQDETAEDAAADDPAARQAARELEPTWQPDEAAGAVWTTAGEAASGRPAAGWGRPEGLSWGRPAGAVGDGRRATTEPAAEGVDEEHR